MSNLTRWKRADGRCKIFEKKLQIFLHNSEKIRTFASKMQKGQERLKIAAWLWSKFFLVHEEVLHSITAKTRNKGIGFKE